MTTKAEREHMRRVKELDCGNCDAHGPSSAHHLIENGTRVGHFATIPLCYDCHQGPNGIHGDKTVFRITKKTELMILAETVEKLAA